MKKALTVALAMAAVAAPAAVASAKGNGGDDRGRHHGRMVSYIFEGVVSADASAVAVNVAEVDGVNRHAMRALNGAMSFTVKLDGNTRIKSPDMPRGVQVALHAGDEVRIEIRAKKGLAVANLPAARRIVNFGPAEDGAPVEEPPVVAPPVVTPPVVQPPVVEPPVVEPPAPVDVITI